MRRELDAEIGRLWSAIEDLWTELNKLKQEKK